MIRDVLMPQLSMGMSEGSIVEWNVQEGALVEKEEPLLSIETEKVVTELPAAYRGYVHILVAAGEKVSVDAVIAQIADAEIEYRQLLTPADTKPTFDYHPPSRAESINLQSDRSIAATSAERVRASGLARKMSRDSGIDVATLTGTGPNGRVVRRDVEASLAAMRQTGVEARTAPESTMRRRARISLSGARKIIADRMVESKTTAAHTYAFFEVDISKLLRTRETMLIREDEFKVRVSMTAFYAKALAVACREVAICNSTLSNNEITVWETVNIGIAVALPGKTEFESSLIVPVVRDAERKGLLELDRDIKANVEAARAGKLEPHATDGGTITLSSSAGFVLGHWLVSTPLLNQPQVVNFQPGSHLDKPVVVDGEVVIRTMLPCGVSFDHRAMDGEPMGRFCRKLADLLANPELMLM